MAGDGVWHFDHRAVRVVRCFFVASRSEVRGGQYGQKLAGASSGAIDARCGADLSERLLVPSDERQREGEQASRFVTVRVGLHRQLHRRARVRGRTAVEMPEPAQEMT